MRSTICAAIRAMPSYVKMLVFWILFGASILMAMAPPLYLAGSGISTPVLGVPVSVVYWLVDALLATGAVWPAPRTECPAGASFPRSLVPMKD
ncbi:hypothetical protein BH11ACT6_BH11ACT6_23810 [soil metagenome]